MPTAHMMHVLVEGGVALTAVLCSCFVIYLAVYRTTNQAVKVYAHMLVMNASVDLAYSLVNLTAMPIFYIIDGYFFIATANPYAPRWQLLAHTVAALQGFLTYTSVVILPIQFIYRYSVMVNRPLDTARLLLCFAAGCVGPFFIGAMVYESFYDMEPRLDAILREDPVLADPDRLPIYGVGDAGRTVSMRVHFVLCLLVTLLSYAVVGFMYFRTNRKFKEIESQITEATKRVQKQMELVIFIQAIFPVLVLFTPCVLLPVASMLKLRFVFMGELISMMMHSTPVFNSVSVVLCVPTYRRTVKRWLCAGGKARVTDSADKHSSTHDDTYLAYF